MLSISKSHDCMGKLHAEKHGIRLSISSWSPQYHSMEYLGCLVANAHSCCVFSERKIPIPGRSIIVPIFITIIARDCNDIEPVGEAGGYASHCSYNYTEGPQVNLHISVTDH